MPKVVGLRLHGRGKVFDFSAENIEVKKDAWVVVETSNGLELASVAYNSREKEELDLAAELKPILREATEEDLKNYEKNCQLEKEAKSLCRDLIEKYQLDMSIVAVNYTLDGQKILFFFSSENRVDFRDLVKDLAKALHKRIELRQIGVRDEARIVGGMASCGRPLCCGSFLEDFVPVSIKMAKVQNLSMNPQKISGACGRLMCCLKYEEEAYEDARTRAPKQGGMVSSPEGEAKVLAVDLLREQALVSFVDENIEQKKISFAELSWDGGIYDLKNANKKNRTKSCGCKETGSCSCKESGSCSCKNKAKKRD